MTKPYPYQKEGVQLISRFKGKALLADEMGLGKTIQSLVWMILNKTSPTIVVCPAGLKINWSIEALQHVGIRAEILYGRTPSLLGRNVNGSRRRLIIVNYEILKAWLPYLKSLNPQLIIIDECQNIQNPKTIKARSVKNLCKDVKKIIALSGTPLTNRPSELFPILRILWPKTFNSFIDYAHKFCRAKKTPWGWEYKGAKNLDKLHRLLVKKGMIRRLTKDVLKQLPKKTRSVVLFELDDKAKKEYHEAEHNFISWLAKQSIHKAKKASKAKNLVQFGYLKRLSAKLKFPKIIKWIDSFLKESDEKIILYAIHKVPIQILAERYKDICVTVLSSDSQKKRHLKLEKFKNSKRKRILIGNIDVLGTGHNITAASAVAFIELSWVPGKHIQAEKRPHRIGQKKRVRCYYLVAQGTIEEDLCSVLQRKQKIIETILDNKVQEDTLDLFKLLKWRIKERTAA